MIKLVVRLARFFMRRGFAKGVRDGNRVWIVVAGIALVVHYGGRALGAEPEVVFSELLEPGDTFTITQRPPG